MAPIRKRTIKKAGVECFSKRKGLSTGIDVTEEAEEGMV